jgi:hypothetical protein
VFWLAVPETYGLSSLALLSSLATAAAAEKRPVPDGWLVAVTTLCAGTALSNAAAGGALLFAYRSPRRALRLALASAGLLVALWIPQRLVFPQPPALVPTQGVLREARFVGAAQQGGPGRALRTALVYSAVAPTIGESDVEASPLGDMLTIQQSALAASGWRTQLLASVWAVALAVGAARWLETGPRRFGAVLAALALSQLGFHAFYGEETFLYALQFVPALVVAACGVLRRARPGVVAAGVLFVLCLAAHNLARLEGAVSTPGRAGVDERLERLSR